MFNIRANQARLNFLEKKETNKLLKKEINEFAKGLLNMVYNGGTKQCKPHFPNRLTDVYAKRVMNNCRKMVNIYKHRHIFGNSSLL